MSLRDRLLAQGIDEDRLKAIGLSAPAPAERTVPTVTKAQLAAARTYRAESNPFTRARMMAQNPSLADALPVVDALSRTKPAASEEQIARATEYSALQARGDLFAAARLMSEHGEDIVAGLAVLDADDDNTTPPEAA